MKTYDVIVIGSGGGTKISSPAASLGFKSAIIERDKVGGTCLNRGCIPSKMLIHPANVAHSIKEAEKLGIHAKISRIDFTPLLKRINKETDGDSKSIANYYKTAKNPAYYPHHAKFVSDKVLEIDGEKITAKKIVISTGARPFIPSIPGLKGTPYMTSSEALRARKRPKKLLVIGGGYIACELGHAYASLGTDVHLIVRDRSLLRREDVDISKEFTKKFAKQYKVHFGLDTEKVVYKNKKFILHTKTKNGKKSTISGDALLVATGIIPNSDQLGLENTKIKTSKRGFVKVNSFMETGVKGVYAIGDVVGNYMFRHSVNYEAEYLFSQLYGKVKKSSIKYPPMPHAVFSNPEIGSVGSTEQELKEKKVPYITGMNSYLSSAQGMARLPDIGFVKLLFHKKNHKLIGAHILGEEASTMIHQLIYAMTFNAKIEDILDMIYIHPALPEIVRNAARNAWEKLK